MREVIVGKKYKHFKGIIVEVIAIAKNTENLEDMVIYNHDGEIWARPYEMFISEVDHDKYPEIKQKYRFQEVNDE